MPGPCTTGEGVRTTDSHRSSSENRYQTLLAPSCSVRAVACAEALEGHMVFKTRSRNHGRCLQDLPMISHDTCPAGGPIPNGRGIRQNHRAVLPSVGQGKSFPSQLMCDTLQISCKYYSRHMSNRPTSNRLPAHQCNVETLL